MEPVTEQTEEIGGASAGDGEGWEPVGTFEDLRRRRKMKVCVGEQEVAVFVHHDEVYALANICIHRQRELVNGVVLKDRIVCPGHQWAFDLQSGWEATKERCQPTYATKVEDGTVFVGREPRVLCETPVDVGT